jgi:hypothetical protein
MRPASIAGDAVEGHAVQASRLLARHAVVPRTCLVTALKPSREKLA